MPSPSGAPSANRFGALANRTGSLPGASNQVSCGNCPSFLDPSRQQTILGKAIGGPTCAKKVIPIGRPGMANENRRQRDIASKCEEYGKPAEFNSNVTNLPIEYTVAFPDMGATSGMQHQPERVRSCTNCTNYVPEFATEDKIGWRAGFCRAKGSLLLPDRLARYALGGPEDDKPPCGFRDYTSESHSAYGSANRYQAINIQLLPEYLDPVNPNSPAALAKRVRSGLKDPREYDTDRPLSDKAKRRGVRAWRTVTDQTGYGPDLVLPIFDLHSIPEVERPADWNLEIELSKVPQAGDDERPEWYVDHDNFVYRVVVAWIKLGETPAIWGEPGVGKTELFRHFAWLMQLPFERISITGTSELDDLAGKMMFSPEKGTYWQNGRVPKAWAKPNVLCIDEPNVGPPPVWQFLRPLTDNSKQLVLDQYDGRRIPAHPATYLGMAMNPAWDVRNVGAEDLGDADGSRLLHVDMGLPPYDVEVEIIRTRLEGDRPKRSDPAQEKLLYDQDTANIKTMMAVAADLRSLAANGTIPISWGLRNQIKVGRLKPYMTWVNAYRLGVADALEPQARGLVLDAVRSHCPEEV